MQNIKNKILDLAIRGKLVPQDLKDEPASVVLERILEEKELHATKGKSKSAKTKTYIPPQNVPFDLPDKWCWCRLNDIGELERGKSKHRPRNDKSLYNNGNIPFIQTGDVTKSNGFILSANTFYNEVGLAQSRLWKKGTVCLTIAANIGDVAILNFDACFPDSVVGFSGDERIIYNKYVLYSLMWYKNELDKLSRATAQKNLNLDILSRIAYPLPPLPEQKRIVEAIEKCFAIIDDIEANKKDLSNCLTHTNRKIIDLAIHGKLVQQVANDEPAIELLKRINPKFTLCETSDFDNLPEKWCVCRLEDIVEYEQPNQYLVETENYSNEYTTPVLTAGKTFILGYTNETEGIYSQLPTIIFDDFTTDSRLVDFPFKVKSSAMKILQVNKEINIKYVAYFMSVTRLLGDSHKRQWIEHYAKVPIPIPPRKEQDRIVNKIEEFEKLSKNIIDEF